jgi:uncharacterized protein RhaS with RHS repeats
VTRSYEWGNQGLLADRAAGTSRYYLFDQFGNTRALLSGAGAVVSRGGFTAWGAIVGPLTPGTPMAWQGAEGCYTDAETGHIQMGARYYAPAVSSLINADQTGS